jgi:hypothetical protein
MRLIHILSVLLLQHRHREMPRKPLLIWQAGYKGYGVNNSPTIAFWCQLENPFREGHPPGSDSKAREFHVVPGGVPWVVEQGDPCRAITICSRPKLQPPGRRPWTWQTVAKNTPSQLIDLTQEWHASSVLSEAHNSGGGCEIAPVLDSAWYSHIPNGHASDCDGVNPYLPFGVGLISQMQLVKTLTLVTTGVCEALTSLEPAGKYFRKGRRSWGLTLNPQGQALLPTSTTKYILFGGRPIPTGRNQIRRTVISLYRSQSEGRALFGRQALRRASMPT